MNKIILLSMMVILPTLKTYGQQRPKAKASKPATVATSAASASAIAAIRTEYSWINALTLKQEAFEFEAAGCVDGGVISYYKDNGAIVKITNSGSIGDGSWTTEFYFKAGKLIFCYDKMIGGAAAEKETTTEYRLYLKDDKPIRCMVGSKITQADNNAATTMKTGYQLLKAYSTKNFSAALCNQ